VGFAQWLRPHRTVPSAPWSAGHSNWRAKPSTVLILASGLWLFGTGEAALVAAGIGVSPWVVFAQGISLKTGLSIGWSTFWISTTVLLAWIPLRRRPGLGTVLNIILIAAALDVMSPILPHPTNLVAKVAEVLIGIGMTGAASAMYITSNLGTGPRDGLMTGIHELTGVRVGRVRTGIEVLVLTAGWLLGGNVGIGTALFGLLIGQSVAVGFGIVSRLFPDD
jgi:uncharacterized membrane protein YczE